jgi:hypothetical protein
MLGGAGGGGRAATMGAAKAVAGSTGLLSAMGRGVVVARLAEAVEDRNLLILCKKGNVGE